MARINFLLVSREASTNADGGLDVKNSFDTVLVERFPSTGKSITIVVNFEFPRTEWGPHVEKFRIEKDGISLAEKETSFEVKTERHQFLHTVQNLPLETPGRYEIRIFLDGHELGSTYFLAKKN